MTVLHFHSIVMFRDLLKWLACGVVVVLGLALVSWGPAGVPGGKSRAASEERPGFSVASSEASAEGGKRVQP